MQRGRRRTTSCVAAARWVAPLCTRARSRRQAPPPAHGPAAAGTQQGGSTIGTAREGELQNHLPAVVPRHIASIALPGSGCCCRCLSAEQQDPGRGRWGDGQKERQIDSEMDSTSETSSGAQQQQRLLRGEGAGPTVRGHEGGRLLAGGPAARNSARGRGAVQADTRPRARPCEPNLARLAAAPPVRGPD
eukprot:scaffold1644_cov357-Prasinococcus_capsulatus_cf.AAC.1